LETLALKKLAQNAEFITRPWGGLRPRHPLSTRDPALVTPV
jgi:hypothetical protein